MVFILVIPPQIIFTKPTRALVCAPSILPAPVSALQVPVHTLGRQEQGRHKLQVVYLIAKHTALVLQFVEDLLLLVVVGSVQV